MTWGRQGLTLGLGLGFALAAGCFQDSGEVGNSASADTGGAMSTGTGDTCPEGTPGCACYGNATCNSNLQCLPDLLLCIPDDCANGDLGCPCDAGVCARELVCTGGLCTEPVSPGTGGSGPSATTAVTTVGATETGVPDDSDSGTAGTPTVIVHAGPTFHPTTDRWSGDLRGYLDDLCATTRPRACSTGRALFSVSPADSIAELAATGVPSGLAVTGPTGIAIAADFDAMVAGELVSALDAVELNGTAEGNPSLYWTSSAGTGEYNDLINCGNWAAPIGTAATGAAGSSELADLSWIAAAEVACETALPILCACW